MWNGPSWPIHTLRKCALPIHTFQKSRQLLSELEDRAESAQEAGRRLEDKVWRRRSLPLAVHTCLPLGCVMLVCCGDDVCATSPVILSCVSWWGVSQGKELEAESAALKEQLAEQEGEMQGLREQKGGWGEWPGREFKTGEPSELPPLPLFPTNHRCLPSNRHLPTPRRHGQLPGGPGGRVPAKVAPTPLPSSPPLSRLPPSTLPSSSQEPRSAPSRPR